MAGPASAQPPSDYSGNHARAFWCDMAGRLATPVLTALAERRLKATMPVEAPDPRARAEYTHLEALGRLLCGLAPWLELGTDASPEGAIRARFAALAREGIDAATDPASPDFMNFSREWQPLVDAAFLAQALLRAPRELWERLPARVQANVVAALQSSRPIRAPETNWKLFASEIEAFFQRTGHPVDRERLVEAVRKFEGWYLGDGVYGDGPEFHWDYYNSFVIHPMLLETLDVVADREPEWQPFHGKVRERLMRYAAIEERLIAPDGTYPALGRSIAYRCGAFQALALAAWRHLLPTTVTPAQVRVALTRVIRRTLEPAGTWDDKGWLQIGLSGHQPATAEPYISTGSLYLCSAALLPLGLPPADPFWSGPGEPTTSEKIWSGRDLGTIRQDR
ncbi:MAG TPA: DUF2264 domain-containing protein [Opitutaceae bacterium]|nr:DUF2264 domain-containing protein [Opitutaceae bacterium]